jgi:hypothetical protein
MCTLSPDAGTNEPQVRNSQFRGNQWLLGNNNLEVCKLKDSLTNKENLNNKRFRFASKIQLISQLSHFNNNEKNASAKADSRQPKRKHQLSRPPYSRMGAKMIIMNTMIGLRKCRHRQLLGIGGKKNIINK